MFQLSIKLTKHKYRILCYHGGSVSDEHLFWPSVFIKDTVFINQMKLINKYKFNVLSLDEIIKQHPKSILPKSLAITFDDGFSSTKKLALILKTFHFPATLYLTSYYTVHQRPIFNVALQYLFYKSNKKKFEIDFFEGKKHQFSIKKKDMPGTIDKIISYAQKLNGKEQNLLLKNISIQLNVDFDSLIKQRIFYNLNPKELKSIYDPSYFDIQLHTHRHELPMDGNGVIYEIEKNRTVISELTGKKQDTLIHLCYPSGLWTSSNFVKLEKLGIQSAATQDYGLNSPDCNKLALKRINCSNKPLIFYEAELCGFDFLLKTALNNLLQFLKIS